MIILFLIIQVTDTSVGLKERISFITPLNVNERIGLKDQIWEELFQKYKILKTRNPRTSSPRSGENFTQNSSKS